MRRIENPAKPFTEPWRTLNLFCRRAWQGEFLVRDKAVGESRMNSHEHESQTLERCGRSGRSVTVSSLTARKALSTLHSATAVHNLADSVVPLECAAASWSAVMEPRAITALDSGAMWQFHSVCHGVVVTREETGVDSRSRGICHRSPKPVGYRGSLDGFAGRTSRSVSAPLDTHRQPATCSRRSLIQTEPCEISGGRPCRGIQVVNTRVRTEMCAETMIGNTTRTLDGRHPCRPGSEYAGSAEATGVSPFRLKQLCVSLCVLVAISLEAAEPLTLKREGHWLTIRGDQIPGQEIQINYLEAYCRAGSTDADWVKHTVIAHRSELVSADEGQVIRIRDTVADGLVVEHTITAGVDEVTFEIVAHNPTDKRSEAHWAAALHSVGRFHGIQPQQPGGRHRGLFAKVFRVSR